MPPHQRIKLIGGVCGATPWKHAGELAVEYLERNIFSYDFQVGTCVHKFGVGRGPAGDKYLATAVEIALLKSLLSLPVKES